MSINRRRLKELKKTLEQGTVSAALRYLDEDPDVLTLRTFREQKLLFRLRDLEQQEKLALAYIRASKQVLNPTEAGCAERYARLSIILTRKLNEISLRVNASIQTIRSLSPIELLEIASEVTDEFFAQARQSFFEYLENLNEEAKDQDLAVSELSDLTEWSLHQTHGATNDIGFAVARALQTAIAITNTRKTRTSGKRLRSVAKEEFADLVHLASNWNSLEYAADMVSYDEWFVREIRQGDPQEITFLFSDPSFEHARTIGFRRSIAKTFFGRQRPRPLSSMLRDFALSATIAGIDFYKGQVLLGFLSRSNYEKVKAQVLRWLDLLDAEDELLLAAAEKDISILAYYLAAIALRGFSEAAKFVKRNVAKKHRRGLTCPRVPVEMLVKLMGDVGIPQDLALAGVESQLIELHTSRHFDIVTRPFIRLSSELIVTLQPFTPGNWPMTVRAALVKGGRLADSYGDIWEAFVADAMQEFGWKILGRGVKIRRNHQVLTDVDILALKQRLLLVIQVKAIAGKGVNTFEHWKARGVVKKGAEQASIAAREIQGNPSFLISVSPSRFVDQTVEQIQPLVVVTSPFFTGWKHRDVPIISSKYLMSLLRGAQVEFKLQDHSVVSTRRFAAGENLTSEEFLQLLKTPLDWQIAGESSETEHQWVDLGDLRMAFPFLRREVIDVTQ
jgi:hypothetical protein